MMGFPEYEGYDMKFYLTSVGSSHKMVNVSQVRNDTTGEEDEKESLWTKNSLRR
jgi:hypothetical protein